LTLHAEAAAAAQAFGLGFRNGQAYREHPENE
jgi:hypothetical protein